MNIIEIIEKKRDNKSLKNEEIKFFVDEYTNGNIADYQAASLLMAIYINKMNIEETIALTDAMKNSGDVIDLSKIEGIKVDKHSTGGVGDKTTLIVGPIVAACGVPVAKMSGRGLGFTGGTIDKLNSIEGFKTTLEKEEFINQVNASDISVIGQTSNIAPADKKIYSLRDVTGTVGNMSLIASSIMSKKLAAGSDAIVLDVKCGKGAFMESFEDAIGLSEIMVKIGRANKKNTIAVITDMNQPLGKSVGNIIEVIEAIEVLKDRGPKDITKLSIELAGVMMYAGKKAENIEIGKKMAEEVIKNGKALLKLRDMIKIQGGDERVIDDYTLFNKASIKKEIKAEKEGYIGEINAKIIGITSQKLGAGREKKEDLIDDTAGIYLLKKVGDYVKKGETIANLYSNDEYKINSSMEYVKKAWIIVSEKTEENEIIKKII